MWRTALVLQLLSPVVARYFGRYSGQEDDRPEIIVSAVLPAQWGSTRKFGTKTLQFGQFDMFNDGKRNSDYNFRNRWFRKYRLQTHLQELGSPVTPAKTAEILCECVKANASVILFPTPWEEYEDSSASTQFFIQLASIANIPTLAWNADNSAILTNQRYSDYLLLQMAPSHTQQLEAFISITRRYNWNRFALVTTRITGHARIKQDLKARLLEIANEHLQATGAARLDLLDHVTIKSVTDKDELQRLMRRLVRSESRIFLLHCKNEEAPDIFEAARAAGLTQRGYLWVGTQAVVGDIKTTMGSNELKKFPLGMMAIHFNTNSGAEEGQGNAIHAAVINGARVISKAIDKLLKDDPEFDFTSNASCSNQVDYKWAQGRRFYEWRLTYRCLVLSLFSAMKQVSVSATTGLDGDDSYTLEFGEDSKPKYPHVDILNLNNEGEWQKIGMFTKPDDDRYEHQLQIRDITWPGGATKPPTGLPEKHHLKVATLEETPFVIANRFENDAACSAKRGVKCLWEYPESSNSTVFTDSVKYRCCSGYCIDLFQMLANDIGFSFDLYRAKDGKWGIRNSTHHWNGLIKELLDKRGDIVVTSLKMNSERLSAIDFSYPWLESGIAIVVALRRGALSPTAFLEPFDWLTWVVVLVVAIPICAFAIFFFEWVSPNSYDRGMRPPVGHRFSLCRVYWLVWATLFSASVTTDVPRSNSARFLALVVAAFAMAFYSVYTANLAAFMITRTEYYDLKGIDDHKLQAFPDNDRSSMPGPVGSRDAALDQKHLFAQLRYGTIGDGNTYATLNANKPAMVAYMKKSEFITKTVHEGVDRVKSGSLDAFLYDARVLEYRSARDKDCSLLTVGKWSAMTGYGFGLPKNSKWLSKINEKLMLYKKRGDLELLEKFWLSGICKGVHGSGRIQNSAVLGVGNFISAFVLLAGGAVVCLLILCLEFVYCNYLRDKITNLDRHGLCGLISMSLARTMKFDEAAECIAMDLVKKRTEDNTAAGIEILRKTLKQKPGKPQTRTVFVNKQDIPLTKTADSLPQRKISSHWMAVRSSIRQE